MADSLNPGDAYVFKLEIQSQLMRLEKGDDFCTEPAKDWFKRQLILPPPARDEMPLPKLSTNKLQKDDAPLPLSADDNPLPGQQLRPNLIPDMGLESDNGTAPLPIAREFVKPRPKDETPPQQDAPPAGTKQQKTKAHVTSDQIVVDINGDGIPDYDLDGDGLPDIDVDGDGIPDVLQEVQPAGVAAPHPPVRDDSLVKRCDRDLVNFWEPGEIVIEGQKFWLSGVFTIDLDGDGRIDDVGFKIKAEGRIGNILNYFPATEGRLSGKTVESLKLEDDSEIHRLCAGNLTFEREDVAKLAKRKRKLAVNQVRTQDINSGNKTATPEQKASEEELQKEQLPQKKTSKVFLIVAGIAMIMLLAGGIGLAMALRNISRPGKDEYEDDDDDDDDYDDEEDDE